jgi:hypothetical protein
MKKPIAFFFILLTLLVLLLNFELNAQATKPSERGVHEHDGFFLRVQGGLGYAQMDEPGILGGDLKLSGIGMPIIVQIGGVIDNNLIAYGQVGGVTVTNPDRDWTSLIMSCFGGGITYYLMPSNVYFYVSALISPTTIKIGDWKKVYYGFGLNLSIGKEWWISDNWALGAALFGHFSLIVDGETGTITNKAVGVVFSTTFN